MGLEPVIVRSPGLAFDVDEPAALARVPHLIASRRSRSGWAAPSSARAGGGSSTLLWIVLVVTVLALGGGAGFVYYRRVIAPRSSPVPPTS